MSIFQTILSAVISALVTIILGLIIKKPLEKRAEAVEKAAEEEKKRSEAIAGGVQAMLRDRLLQGYQHYIDKGYADYQDRSNMENLWKNYHNLGQNGAMNDLRHIFRKLPQTAGGPPTVIDDDNDDE